MSTSTGSFFLSPSSGEGSAHADRLHLSAWLCDHGRARHAPGVARAPSSHLLLAHLPPSRAPGAQNGGRDGPVDARDHHRLALWTRAQSRLLDRPSPRVLVGAGPPRPLAAPCPWRAVSLWRRQSCRHTRYQTSRGAKRAPQPAASLVSRPALRGVGG